MSSVVIVSPPIVAEALASSWSGRFTAPLTLNVTVVVAPRSEACDPAFACSWVTSCWGRVSVAVPVASKRSDWTFDIAVPVALRLWLGVSERAAAGAVRPAQAERRPSARKAIRVRFMPATTICTAAARNVTFRHGRRTGRLDVEDRHPELRPKTTDDQGSVARPGFTLDAEQGRRPILG